MLPWRCSARIEEEGRHDRGSGRTARALPGARDALLAAIHGLSDAQMTEPSLDGWSVKDHLAHLALWDDVTTR
jgi:hypothetical protein